MNRSVPVRSNNNLIIVGNGSSLLNSNNGHKIDSFNTVVRFNSFKIKGFEKDVGTRTDIWFTVNGAHINDINNFTTVIAHSWEWDPNRCKMFQRLLAKRSDCIKISRDFVRNNVAIHGPSTGIIAIFWFLERYDSLTLTGFDWWDCKKHHYGDREARGTLHNPRKEFEIINSFVKEGRITFL
jgi:hypothetical protein